MKREAVGGREERREKGGEKGKWERRHPTFCNGVTLQQKVGCLLSHLLLQSDTIAEGDCLASASSFQKIQLHLLLQSMSLRTRGRKQKYHVG